ncbi:MAG TPA: hypothetical protein VJU53_04465 [Burkholderiaceae bacterium]|nr:hypothetical protein [Burkholderiaceae bacterium]
METTSSSTGYSGAVSGTATMGNTGKQADQAAQSAHSTVDQVAQSAHETVDRIASKAGSALDRARATASDVEGTAQTQFDDLINGEWVETVRDEVRARPLAAVGIALAAGLLMSRLL